MHPRLVSQIYHDSYIMRFKKTLVIIWFMGMGSWNFVWLITVLVDSLLLIVHCWLPHFPSMLLSYLPELIFQAQKLLLTGSSAVTALKLVRSHFLCQIKKKKSTRAGVKAFRVYFRVAASKDKVHTTCLILSLFSASAGLGSRRSPMSNHQGITAWTETKISLAFTDEPYMSPWSWRWQHNQNLQGTSQISNSYSRRQLMDNIPSSLSKTHAGKIT